MHEPGQLLDRLRAIVSTAPRWACVRKITAELDAAKGNCAVLSTDEYLRLLGLADKAATAGAYIRELEEQAEQQQEKIRELRWQLKGGDRA